MVKTQNLNSLKGIETPSISYPYDLVRLTQNLNSLKGIETPRLLKKGNKPLQDDAEP